MPLIEMAGYKLAPVGSGEGLEGVFFTLDRGDVCTVQAANSDDAHQFLRALATLAYPLEGTMRYMGQPLDLRSYRALLGYKKKIAYLASDAALISNLTIRQNILLQRYCAENDLSIDLDDNQQSLCHTLGISRKLDMRPAELNHREQQMAIVIRELGKGPEIVILERPEDFSGYNPSGTLARLFKAWIDEGKPVVALSNDRRFIRRFATRGILIASRSLTPLDVRPPTIDG